MLKMNRNRFLGHFYYLCFCFLFSVHVHISKSREASTGRTYTISSIAYPKSSLQPYDWSYIKVDLPPWFSSMSLSLETDADTDISKLNNGSGSSVPIICFREGSPPVPDVYDTSLTGFVPEYISNGSFLSSKSLQNAEKCYPLQKSIFLRLTNEQISSGTWYFGIFNGIGAVRTQSKMINRGSSYSFSGNVSVEGCTISTMLGPSCNLSANILSCNTIDSLTGASAMNSSAYTVVACQNADGLICHGNNSEQIYSLEVMELVEELHITASNLTFSGTQRSNITGSYGLICYARHEAIPLETMHDFSGEISNNVTLVIKFPKRGRWYITIRPSSTDQNRYLKSCYVLRCLVNFCPPDKAGLNCAFERYMLQAHLRKNPAIPYEAYYVPNTETMSTAYPLDFSLESFLSNSTAEMKNDSWTFFTMDIPYGASGENIHFRLSSDANIDYEVYARYGGLPSVIGWDYFYANSTSNSNGSMFFKLYDSKENQISFSVIYARAGIWCFGFRKLDNLTSTAQTSVALSLERCPKKCSSHGTCQMSLDYSGLALYSYCACDRNYGGFDCSIELVSHRGHVGQSIFLIGSNVAAILPAYWALRRKAFAEWVLFTSSGVSSALYHACDVGTWCVLSFHVLQFLDFWLSFMAVVSTFVYLTAISEVGKRTIHTVVAIITALLAETGPTSGKNIAYVLGLGSAALVVGLSIEFGARHRRRCNIRFGRETVVERWEATKEWVGKFVKRVVKRFKWGAVVLGLVTLGMAAVSWEMEKTESYWIWHSLWHIFIYTSSFFFLCSKQTPSSSSNGNDAAAGYELTSTR